MDIQEIDLTDCVLLPNGALNAPFVLANAKILLEAEEPLLALRLFSLVKNHPKLSHCAHYGIGQCFLILDDLNQARRAFENAFRIEKKTYIAKTLLEVLIQSGHFKEAEKKSLEFASLFSKEEDFVHHCRFIYEEALRERVP